MINNTECLIKYEYPQITFVMLIIMLLWDVSANLVCVHSFKIRPSSSSLSKSSKLISKNKINKYWNKWDRVQTPIWRCFQVFRGIGPSAETRVPKWTFNRVLKLYSDPPARPSWSSVFPTIIGHQTGGQGQYAEILGWSWRWILLPFFQVKVEVWS